MCPKAALFDLDDTLAQSFKAPSEDMMERLSKLHLLVPIAILSGADFLRIKRELLDRLQPQVNGKGLFAFPDSASQGYEIVGSEWQLSYSLDFTPQELEQITSIVLESVGQSGILGPHPTYEPELLTASTQVRYAALGLSASEEDKMTWDPDKSKRIKLKALLEQKLPECEVLIGGKTTLDITKKGVNKAYGVMWLSQKLGIPATEMLYVGDALYEGGNDHVVIPTGVQTRSTSGPDETLGILDALLKECQAN